eukprot:1913793-Rhodomonas_salina.1
METTTSLSGRGGMPNNYSGLIAMLTFPFKQAACSADIPQRSRTNSGFAPCPKRSCMLFTTFASSPRTANRSCNSPKVSKVKRAQGARKD